MKLKKMYLKCENTTNFSNSNLRSFNLIKINMYIFVCCIFFPSSSFLWWYKNI